MRNLNRLTKFLATTCLFILLSQQAMAQSESDDGWNHSLAVYLWGSSIGGTTADGSGVSVDFKDLVDKLEFAAMGAYQGRKGKWSVLADVMYIDLSGGGQQTITLPIEGGNAEVSANANMDLTTWVVSAAGGYKLYDDGEGTITDLVFGARYLDLSTDLMLSLDIDLPNIDPSLSVSSSESVLDAIIGARGVISLGDRWFLPWGANVGAGDSDLTWQAQAGVAFRASSWADIALTYRYLKWELDNEVIADLSFSGPQLGVIFRF